MAYTTNNIQFLRGGASVNAIRQTTPLDRVEI